MALWQSLGGTISVEITTADISSALTAIQNANIAIQDALFVDLCKFSVRIGKISDRFAPAGEIASSFEVVWVSIGR